MSSRSLCHNDHRTSSVTQLSSLWIDNSRHRFVIETTFSSPASVKIRHDVLFFAHIEEFAFIVLFNVVDGQTKSVQSFNKRPKHRIGRLRQMTIRMVRGSAKVSDRASKRRPLPQSSVSSRWTVTTNTMPNLLHNKTARN